MGLVVWGVTTSITLLLYIFVDMPAYPRRALPLVWGFYSWNFYAYSFGRRMWPWQFNELQGQGKGNPNWRAFWFWFSAMQYVVLLVAILWGK